MPTIPTERLTFWRRPAGPTATTTASWIRSSTARNTPSSLSSWSTPVTSSAKTSPWLCSMNCRTLESSARCANSTGPSFWTGWFARRTSPPARWDGPAACVLRRIPTRSGTPRRPRGRGRITSASRTRRSTASWNPTGGSSIWTSEFSFTGDSRKSCTTSNRIRFCGSPATPFRTAGVLRVTTGMPLARIPRNGG